MYTKVSKLASAVRNNVNSGLQGMHINDSLSRELIEDSITLERLLILKEYALKGIMPYKDLYISINCIPIDCQDIEKCSCKLSDNDLTPTAHFEIPLLMNDYGVAAIEYIGSNDKQQPFIYYTSLYAMNQHKYRKRGKNKPYVWIDCTPNKNLMYDCYVFNAPFLKQISVIGIFKDLRQLEQYGCCITDDNVSFIDNEIVKRLSEKLLRYYRLAAQPVTPNNQMYDQG